MNLAARTFAASILLAAAADAAVLFENVRAGFTPTGNIDNTLNANNQQFAATKVVVTGAGWTIDSVTVSNNVGNLGGADPATLLTTAHLHIVADADLASYDPTTGNIVAATIGTFTPGSFIAAGLFETVASAGGVTLAPGTYWIGATPILDNPAFGGVGLGYGGMDVVDSVHYAGPTSSTGTSTTPNAVETWEPIDGSADDTPVGIAIRIEGTVVPEPGSALLAGLGMVTLLLRRRR